MLYGFLVTLYIIIALLLALLILVQQGKDSMGIGALGGSSQMLFGGSGGQDVLQKATWVLGALFMMGSLVLAIMKSASFYESEYISTMPTTQQTSQAQQTTTKNASNDQSQAETSEKKQAENQEQAS
jgi:preprotein translocase subunit SecG